MTLRYLQRGKARKIRQLRALAIPSAA